MRKKLYNVFIKDSPDTSGKLLEDKLLKSCQAEMNKFKAMTTH